MKVRSRILTAVIAALILVTACVGGSFDRNRAIDDAIRDSGGRMTREQAECYVDRVRSELGTAALKPGVTIPLEQRGRLVTIRVDCVGVANMGTTSTPEIDEAETEATFVDRGPQSFGDDPELDALYTACAEGWGKACDELYDAASVDSDYERFASACGDRTHEIVCYDVYPSPGVTLPSDAQTTTTVAPEPP